VNGPLLERLRKTFVIVSLLCLAGWFATLYYGGKPSTADLLGAGWGTYMGVPGNNKVLFSTYCLVNGVCRPVLWQRFAAQDLFLLFQVSGTGFLIFLLAAGVVALFSRTEPGQKDPGGGNFATDADLKAYLFDTGDAQNPRKGHYGYTESGRQLRAPLRDRCTHLAIFAGTGGGKTTRIIKPSLIQDALDGTSVLMVDPKWPDPQGGYSDTLAVFKQQGYEVQVFCPFETHTLRLPLIRSLKSPADAEVLASTIIPKTAAGEVSDGSQFYRNQERELLKHLLWGEAQAGRGSIGDIYDLIDGGPVALTKWLRDCKDPKIHKSMTTLMQNRQETLIGIVQGLKGNLSIFTNERLDAATQAGADGWQNLDVTSLTRRKSVLYVGIPQQMFLRGEGKLLLNLFFRRIMDEVLGVATTQGGRLERHLAVYIDEFAHIGKLEQAGTWFGMMRSYNIAFTVALQNRAQLEMVYGSVGARAMEGGNFQHLITFPASLKGDDKEYVSKLLGDVTAEDVAKSKSRQNFFEPYRYTETRRRVARPLLSREEMNRWNADYGVLIPHGAGPTKIAAPMITQRQVGRVKNGFYTFRDLIGTGNSLTLVETLLSQRRLTWRSPEPPEPSAKLQTPKLSEAITPRSDVFEAEQAGIVKASPQETAFTAPFELPNTHHEPVAKQPRRAAQGAKKPPGRVSAKTKPQLAVKKGEALHHIPSGELMPSFRLWVEGLNWRDVPLTIFRVREGGQNRISKILFEQLPGALRHEHLAHWKQRHWIRIHGGKLGIVNTGCTVLCQQQLETLLALPQAQIVEIGEGSERVVVKSRAKSAERGDISNPNVSLVDLETATPEHVSALPFGAEYTPKAQAALRAWVLTSGYRLDGHPDYACYQDLLPHKALLGRYTPEQLYVQDAYLKNLPEFPAEAITRFPAVEKNIGGKRVLTREIPGQLAHRIMPLKKLLTEDAALLEDHPSRAQAVRPVGKYHCAEILGQKQTLQEVTGVSLEHLKKKVLKAGQRKQENRRSMRLVSIRLLPEPLTAPTS